MSLTAVVLGATGLVGSELVGFLLASDQYARVITVSRRPLKVEHEKLESCVVDFECLEDVADKVSGDVLFSCLGTTKKQAGSIAAQRVVDHDYQLQVARFAASNAIPHYCLVSSSGANPASASAYMKMKGDLERAVKQLVFKRVSIFQPSLLLGDRETVRLGESLGSIVVPWLCRLPMLKPYRPITGREVAEKMLQVSLAPGSGEAIFNLQEVFPD